MEEVTIELLYLMEPGVVRDGLNYLVLMLFQI